MIRPRPSFTSTRPTFSPRTTTAGNIFLRSDHQRLAAILLNAEGLWLLSYNLCPEVLELYQQPGILIEQVDRINNMAQRYEGGAVYREVLISNYDTRKSAQAQLYLFELAQRKGKYYGTVCIKNFGKERAYHYPWPIRKELDFGAGDVLLFEADPPDRVVITRMEVYEPEEVEEPDLTGDIFTEAFHRLSYNQQYRLWRHCWRISHLQ